jgi:hypothetical protein
MPRASKGEHEAQDAVARRHRDRDGGLALRASVGQDTDRDISSGEGQTKLCTSLQRNAKQE